MPSIDARYYKTLLICPHKAMGGEVGPLLASTLPLAPVQNVAAYPGRKELVDLQKSFEPKLVLLDCTSEPERAASVLSDISAVLAGVPVVALLGTNSPDLILRCMRQGAAEFLMRPFTADQFNLAFEKIVRLYPPPQSRRLAGAKSVALVPVKGACGATTIACNLAIQTRKTNSGKVLLADLDPFTGTVSFLLKLRTNFSFLDILARGSDSADSDLWKQIVVPTQGVDVLLPPDGLMEGLDDLPEATAVIESAQENYDTVVVDCGSAFGRWNLSAAAACDYIMLISTNELAALQATQRVIGWYERSGVDLSKLRLVINRYNREVGLTSEAISKAVDADVFHLIPSDYEALQKAIMDGKSAGMGSNFGKSIVQLSERLLGNDRSAESEKSGSRKRFGLF